MRGVRALGGGGRREGKGEEKVEKQNGEAGGRGMMARPVGLCTSTQQPTPYAPRRSHTLDYCSIFPGAPLFAYFVIIQPHHPSSDTDR